MQLGDMVDRSIPTQDPASRTIRVLWTAIEITWFNFFTDIFQPILTIVKLMPCTVPTLRLDTYTILFKKLFLHQQSAIVV